MEFWTFLAEMRTFLLLFVARGPRLNGGLGMRPPEFFDFILNLVASAAFKW